MLHRRTTQVLIIVLGCVFALATVAQSARAAGCAMVSARRGSAQADARALKGPGVVLVGGGAVDAIWPWIHNTLVGGSGRGGDITILAPSAKAAAAAASRLQSVRFNSVRTMVVPADCIPGEDAADVIDHTGAVWIADGETSVYTAWRGTPLAAALQRVYSRRGVIAGSGGGAAVLAALVFNGAEALSSRAATANPYDPEVTFARGIVALPLLRDALVDTRFVKGDRFGRLAAFMVRELADGAVKRKPPTILGIGIDVNAAIAIDRNGVGAFYEGAPGAAVLFLRTGPADYIAPGDPLIANTITTTLLKRAGQTFDFKTWCASAPTYVVGVDGDPAGARLTAPTNPYTDPLHADIPHC